MPSLKDIDDAEIVDVTFTASHVTFELRDGRFVAMPLTWSPRLYTAEPSQREYWEILGPGVAVHWPELDEDVSIENVLRGTTAPIVEYRRFEVTVPDLARRATIEKVG